MKRPLPLALLVTLALSLASAQNTTGDGTLAGTPIENTATGAYDDPTNPSGPQGTLTSNTVTTTVLPMPGFDIVYRDGNDGLMNGTVSPGNTAGTAAVTATVTPGTPYNTPYTVVNNGNTVQTITLSSDTTGSTTAPTVAYYEDTDKDGILDPTELAAGVITQMSLRHDDPTTTADEGIAYFIQVLTVPAGAAPGAVYAASPVGAGQTFDSGTRLPVSTTESTSSLGLQFTTLTVANQPPVPADVTNTALSNAAPATTISGLVATDDGSVASYTIVSLPSASSGVLYLADGTTPVTAGMVLTPAQAASLRFDPAPGFVGNATFDYAATDNLGLASTTNTNADNSVTSGPATFTIPVTAASADLQIQKTNTKAVGWTDQAADTVKLGNTTFYFIRVTNNGPSPVTGAVVKDTLLSNGLSITNATCSSDAGNKCTTDPNVAQLTSATGYTLPVTLNSGEFFEFYVWVPVTSVPTTPTAGSVTNTATVSLPAGMTDPTPANNTATDEDRVAQPPIPNDATNTPLQNTDGPIQLSPNLSASDDGAVVSYTIQTLPLANTGVLSYNGAALTAGQTITDRSGLTFDPAPGFIGNATFEYSATDNEGLTSTQNSNTDSSVTGGPATYTIPVQPVLGALQCTSTVYGLFGVGVGTMITLNSIDASGNIGPAVASLPYQNTAAMAISTDGTKVYTAGADYVLREYNTVTGVWTTLGTLPVPSGLTARPVRMATDKNGTVYISTANVLWTYNSASGISAAKTLNFTDTTGLTPAPDLGTLTSFDISGDFIVDNDGNLYLLANPGTSNYLDMFRIQNLTSATPTVTYAGRLRDTDIGSVTYAGFAAIPSGIYAASTSGRYVNTDLGALSVTLVNANMGSVTTDLGSCYFPTLRPALTSTKTVTDVNGGTLIAGDVLEYTITVNNSGTIAATGVTFQDTLPANTTYVPGSTTMNGTAVPDNATAPLFPYTTAKTIQSAGTDVANGLNLVGTGQDVVIKFRVTVNTGASTITNQGDVGYTDNQTGSPVPTTQKTDDPTVSGTADPTVISAGAPILGVTKAADKFVRVTPDPTNDTQLTLSPAQVKYTLTVQNTGNAPATNVVVTDTLPAGITYVSATGTPALATAPTVSGQQLTFNVGSLAAGATQVIEVTTGVTVTPNTNQTAISNTATGQADALSPVTSAPALTDIVYPKLGKTVQNITQNGPVGTNAAGLPGEVLEYCLNYYNYGSVALPNYKLTDFVPGNTTALTTGYDSVAGGTGYGVKVTQGATTYRTSAMDADGGQLTSTGGDFSQGTMTLSLGTLPANTAGSACFRVTIK